MTDDRPDEAKVAAASGDSHWQQKMARLRSRQLPSRTLDFYDDELQRAIDQAQMEHITAQADDKVSDEDKATKEAAYEAAKTAFEDATVSIPLRALPRPAYEALINAHPPTDEQEQEGEAYNVDTFASALVAACSVEPMENDEARELLDTLNQGEAMILFRTCVQLNEQVRIAVGKDSRPTRG